MLFSHFSKAWKYNPLLNALTCISSAIGTDNAIDATLTSILTYNNNQPSWWNWVEYGVQVFNTIICLFLECTVQYMPQIYWSLIHVLREKLHAIASEWVYSGKKVSQNEMERIQACFLFHICNIFYQISGLIPCVFNLKYLMGIHSEVLLGHNSDLMIIIATMNSTK